MSSSDPSGQQALLAEIRQAQEAYRAGRIDAAESRINAMARRHPNHHEVLTAQGMIQMAKGQQEAAFGSFQKVLETDPRRTDALAWAAFAALNLQRFEEAERLSRRFVEVEPTNARSHFLLASSLRALGHVGPALQAIDRSLELNPRDPQSLVTKGRLLQEWQMPALATQFYQQAMSIRPTPAAGMELARMLMRDSHHEEALKVFDQISPLMHPSEKPYSPIAQALTLLHRFDEADKYWKLTLKQTGNAVTTAQSQALVEIAAGRFEVAERLLFELIEQGREVATSFSILSTGRKMKSDDLPMIERMVELSRGPLSPSESIDLPYALGKSFDDLRDYERAIFHYDQANRVCLDLYRQRRSYDREQSKAFTDFLIELASPERLAKLVPSGEPEDFPLFVVGMMRSGTTLTETILSGHSQIQAGGEQAFWTERVIDFIYLEGESLGYSHDTVQRFAKDYLDLVKPKAPGTRYVVDKNPGNIEIAGILHSALPNAKMIHMKRHPVDNLLSIWMTPLSAHVRYASDRSNLVFTYRQYMRLWKHLESVLPEDRFRTFRYEDLTSEPVETITSMLNYLDVPVEEACFAPEKTTRSVLTPSVYQVRQAIHKGSQARWRNYEPWLAEFRELLDDPEAQ